MAVSEDFTNPGQGPDYRLNNDGKAATLGWRRETPPFAEDGSVPSRRLTVAPSLGINYPSGSDQAGWVRRGSTFDIPNSELG